MSVEHSSTVRTCRLCGATANGRNGFCREHRNEEARKNRLEVARRFGFHDRRSSFASDVRPARTFYHVDLAGIRFEHWDVLRVSRRDDKKRLMWAARCIRCNAEHELIGDALRNGLIKLCPTCESRRVEEKSMSRLWRAILSNARFRGYPVEISREYAFRILADQNNRCAMTGLPIRIAIGTAEFKERKRRATASLDRIDSSKGYVEGNVWWVHKDVNRMKSDFSLPKLLTLCRMIAAKFPDVEGETLEGNNSCG